MKSYRFTRAESGTKTAILNGFSLINSYYFYMSESKRQEGSNLQGERRDPDQTIQNNPFSSYMSNINHSPHEKQPSRRKERERSSSSQRSQRSNSREQRQKQKKIENDPAKQEQYDQKKALEKKDYRDRGAINPSKKEQQKDESYYKTKLCPLNEKVREAKTQGQCKKGSSCSFAHSQKEVRGLPNFRKTRLCIPFKNGQCPKPSADCKYAHGQAEIRKLAYDYFPQKNHQFNKYERYERNEKNDRFERNDRRSDRDDRREREYRDRYERSDRDRGYKDRPRDRDEGRDRYKEYNDHYKSKDYSRIPSSSGAPSNPQAYSQNLGPYISNYNSAYMIPPAVSSFGQSGGELYSSSSASHPGAGTSSNYASSSSSMPPAAQGQGSYAPPLYNMGPSYEYGFGYLPHNYPPFNSSSV